MADDRVNRESFDGVSPKVLRQPLLLYAIGKEIRTEKLKGERRSSCQLKQQSIIELRVLNEHLAARDTRELVIIAANRTMQLRHFFRGCMLRIGARMTINLEL